MRRGIPVVLALAAAFAMPIMVAAQDYTIAGTTTIPSVYHVGDQVELRLSLRSDFAAKMVPPAQVAQPSWGSIEAVELATGDGEAELRLRFTSWAIGTRALPPINLGPVVVEGVTVFVTALTDAASEFNPPFDPLPMPSLAGRVALQFAVVVAVPLGLFVLGYFGVPALRRAWLRRREHRPYRTALRALRHGAMAAGALDAAAFYEWLLAELRRYLSERCGIPAMACTTSDIERLLAARIARGETVRQVSAVCRRADRVRFAGEPIGAQARQDDLAAIEAALTNIEQEERLRAVDQGSLPPVVGAAGRQLGQAFRASLPRVRGGGNAGL